MKTKELIRFNRDLHNEVSLITSVINHKHSIEEVEANFVRIYAKYTDKIKAFKKSWNSTIDAIKMERRMKNISEQGLATMYEINKLKHISNLENILLEFKL